MNNRHGFTLVELSIVIVIIGLIVGGIILGQELILAAAIRSQISQFEKLETALNTFRNKYNCFAGDCPIASTFFSGTCFSGQMNGDGDGRLFYDNPGNGQAEDRKLPCHLFLSGLMAENPAGSFGDITIPAKLPGTVLTFNAIYSGLNALSPVNQGYYLNTSSPSNYSRPSFSAVIAFNIDTKIDDGNATGGKVRAGGFVGSIYGNPTTSAAGGTGCVITATTSLYNTLGTTATACGLAVRLSGFPY